MKGRIALFLHQPKCSVQSGNGIMRALSPNYTFKIFTRHEVERDFFEDVDMICFPGGIGDADSYDYLLKDNAGRVQDFVQNGGRYLGICMGAYWASRYYFNIVKDIDAEQYITRPGTDTRRPHAKAQQVSWQGQEEHMFFYDGCSLVGNGIDSSDVWAVYPNGDPMALIQNRVGLIGCHPEADKHWYESYSWMPKHWHKYRHHDLLLDFANAIMSK
jgi:glutamine amidotransferase-like uncharacterized protein